MKELSFWINANKIALNVAKAEVILCKRTGKACDTDLRLKLKKEENVEKRLNRTKFVRYLIIKFNENLS